ncbi:type VII secretion-associated protein [Mycobacterium haemophilum]|uniref:Type VII secretion-associated protein n=1 Tax=Mycobacterium haemophilum TaxID=29311 RepID=A0A0I9U0R7_9MYCO|nr:type VII secretion-associated protein [Mycobacterium haemophilum]KLO28908.1 Type VII secretion-associated protein [Mycobacterium haemophilum]KLO35659.1 Type VII secretion-associated protein [Mycobacterium haemophilum]KLO41096.1 Type VII secretion-associated protein [Mycobacterium haemophilum]KLO49077.1 Type VII secretion-associated protein [Mycobacterium haemophilum]
MSAHRTIIDVGPGTIRRLCCDASHLADSELPEMMTAVLDSIDDQVALVSGRPVAVDALWRMVLRSLDCGCRDGMVVVHPSWWSASRVGVVTTAARALTGEADDVVAWRRSWLLTQASSDIAMYTPPQQPVLKIVVEIADRLVAIAGVEVVAVPRRAEPHRVAEEVAGVIAGMTRDTTAVVLIDAPGAVAGASALATLIASAVRDGGTGHPVLQIDDARLARLARTAVSSLSVPGGHEPRPAGNAGGARSRDWVTAKRVLVGVAVAAAAPVVAVAGRLGELPRADAPTTFLLEGRVALTVPANWRTQRVVGGPGSARVQVTSPLDPEVALHVTQSPVAGETLSGTADRLKRAIDAEPVGTFIDFNPSGISAGRPAVTYREVRAGHHVRWTVMLDGAVRISIGCQSRPGGEDALREVCDQAVRSAHAVG